MPASQQAGQQRATAPHRSLDFRFIGRDQAAIAFIFLPGDIALVVLEDQYLPLLRIAPDLVHDTLAPLLDYPPPPRATVGVGARVYRVGQDLADGIVHRQLPGDTPSMNAGVKRAIREFDPFLPEPQEYLANTPELGEFAEYVPNRVAHPLVGVERDGVAADLHVSGRQVQEQLAPLRLLATGVV